MNIALITNRYPGEASVIEEHIAGVIRHAPGRVWRIDVNDMHRIPLWIFDAVIIHYGVTIRKGYTLNPQSRERIARFRGPKALFIQDEYRWINATVDAMVELGIDILFTVVPQGDILKVYRDPRVATVIKRETYTGYVNPDYVARAAPPTDARPLDIGYRGRPVPFWLGSLGQEKTWIVDRTLRDASRHGLAVDLSYDEKSRIYGDAWPTFLESCKAVLGSESGASVCDFTDEIRLCVDAHLAREPGDTYEEVEAACFPGMDGKVVIATISPRMFEAAALRTLMILYEGEYAGVFTAGRHFVALKKDHSNFDDVAHVLRTPALRDPIIRAAYDEIARNRAYWPEALAGIMAEAFDAYRHSERASHGWRMSRPAWLVDAALATKARALRMADRLRPHFTLAPGRVDQVRRVLGRSRDTRS